MRILITGGFGFVGGRLGQYLHEIGHRITLGSRAELIPPDWLPRADVIKTDWQDMRALEKSCAGFDAVIHAAGMNAPESAADPIGALEFNGVATARLAVAASRAGVKCFIYLSTAHVYGSPLSGTLIEASYPRNLHPYATSHLSGEHAVLWASQSSGIKSFVLRLSNVFGAPAHGGVNCWMLLVNDLCRQAVETQQLVLNSSGLQQRDFIPMADVCRLIGLLVAGNFPTGRDSVLNVGSGRSESILAMTELIRDRCTVVLGYAPTIHRPSESADRPIDALVYRIDGLKKLGLEPLHSPIPEIDKLLDFCRVLYRANGSGRI